MSRKIESGSAAHDLNWFHLGTLLSSSFSLPMIIVGEHLAIQYGTGKAICSILVGNLIIWLIGSAVISMAIEERSNAIENVRKYFGKTGAIFMWIILMISFLNWFVLQISAAIPSIGIFFDVEKDDLLLRLGAGFGLFTTLLSLGGIRLIKWLICSSTIFVVIYYLYTFIQSESSIRPISSIGLPVPAIISVILVILPGILNLPTLFRHSKSKSDCYLGLSMMICLFSLYEIGSLWMQFDQNSNMIYLGTSVFSICTLVFVCITLININLINIYFASACWEIYVPRFEGSKGYAIIGLLGTAAYSIIQIYAPLRFIENLSNCFLVDLGIVLLIAYLAGVIVKHRPRKYERLLNGFCLAIGCITASVLTILYPADSIYPLIVSAAASVSAFFCVIFIEENLWAIKRVSKAKRNHAH